MIELVGDPAAMQVQAAEWRPASPPSSTPSPEPCRATPKRSIGAFEAIEGNYQDAVTHTSRTTGEANVVFIRAT